jgi:hypothetical protein
LSFAQRRRDRGRSPALGRAAARWSWLLTAGHRRRAATASFPLEAAARGLRGTGCAVMPGRLAPVIGGHPQRLGASGVASASGIWVGIEGFRAHSRGRRERRPIWGSMGSVGPRSSVDHESTRQDQPNWAWAVLTHIAQRLLFPPQARAKHPINFNF